MKFGLWEFFQITGVEIFSQEDIREHGSKLEVAKNAGWLSDGSYVIYIDDMNAHLEPFESEVDFCIHADWGYDIAQGDSFTQGQTFKIISAVLRLSQE